MNAYNMYQQQIAMAHMNNQPAHSHEFFAGNPRLEPSAFSPDATRPPMDPHNPGFTMPPQHQQMIGILGSIPESHNSATSGDIMQNLAASGYPIDGLDISNIASKPNYMAYDGAQNYMFDPPYQMGTSVQDFGAQFGEMPGTGDGYDFQTFVPGAPMQATASNGSTPSIPSTLSSIHSNSTMASSTGMSVPSLSSTEWSEDSKPTISFSQAQDIPSAYSSPPEDGTPLQQQPVFEQTYSPEEITRPSSSQNFPPTPPNQVGELDPYANFPSEAFSRRPSSTNGLAESMGNVDLQQRSASMDAAFRQPGVPAGLAARRQRPRPAALGQESLRSASYSAGMPVSPGSNANLSAPDLSLRRVRSNGVTGVQTGRIQKPSHGSGQRSPMHMSFTEAAASPKFAPQASQFATVSSPGQINLAPPTPLTPNEGARFPSWQSHPSVNTSLDHDSPNGIAMSWASESPAVFSQHVSSPPETPLDAEQAAAYQTYLHNASIYRDTPPQSAPANQQSFAAFGPPAPQMNGSLSVNTAHMAHIRRPSLPDNVNMAVPQVPMLHAPTGDMPLTYEPMPYNGPQYSHPPPPPQPQVTLLSQTTAAFPNPSLSAPTPVSMQQSNLLSADFVVHEYSPPSAQGCGKNSGSPTCGPRESSTPKVFHFANQGPKDFEGQQSS